MRLLHAVSRRPVARIPRCDARFTDVALPGGVPFYVARKGARVVVVHGRRRSPAWDEIRDLCCAYGRPFYSARRDRRWSIVWGSRCSRAFDSLVSWSLLADGRPLYVARRGRRHRVVWGRSEGPAFDAIRMVGFAAGMPHYVGLRAGRQLCMAGRREVPSHIDLHLFPGGSREVLRMAEAYHRAGLRVARARRGFRVAWNGGKSEAYDEIGHLFLVDGKPLYSTRRGRRWRVVLGDVAGPTFDRIFSLRTEKGRLSYGALSGRVIEAVTHSSPAR